jgi:hypothetical protein
MISSFRFLFDQEGNMHERNEEIPLTVKGKRNQRSTQYRLTSTGKR